MNLVNKQGHTMGWDTPRYINTIEAYLGRKIDIILVNKEEFSPLQRGRYLNDSKAGEQIFIRDEDGDQRIIRDDLLSKKIIEQNLDDQVPRSLIRHDSSKLAKSLKKIIE
jgi:hypothetical protein